MGKVDQQHRLKFLHGLRKQLKNLEKADKISAVGSVPMSYGYCGSLYSYAER